MQLGAIGAWYAGHENENAYRNYPFSETADLHDTEGIELSNDLFVDAFVYPIVPAPTPVWLTLLDMPAGKVEISGEGGVLATGECADGRINLYDGRERHVGTLLCGPGWDREKASGRTRRFGGATLAAAACAPIVYSGVLSVSDENGGNRTETPRLILEGDDQITPHVKGNKLWFDVLPKAKDPDYSSPVRRIYFYNAGKALIRASKDDTIPPNTVEVLGFMFDREDVCWQAHKEDSVAVAVDTCESDDPPPCDKGMIPDADETPIQICADDTGFINIVSTDYVGFKNPVVVSTVSGQTIPQTATITPGLSQEEMIAQGSKLSIRHIIAGNGIKISIPGLDG